MYAQAQAVPAVPHAHASVQLATQVVAGCIVAPSVSDGYRPEWRGDVFRPSPAQECYSLGHQLGCAGQFVDPPHDLRPDCLAAFQAGYKAGFAIYEAEQYDWDAAHDRLMVAIAFGEVARTDAEVIEALGIRALAKGAF